MHIIVDFCLIPLKDESLSPYIAKCQKILEKQKLEHHLHAFGTTVEGEWDPVMQAIKHCHEAVHDMGAQRISTTLKIGSRTDKVQSGEDKIKSVQSLLV